MSILSLLTKHRSAFESFLTARGAEILQPTNEWEMLRFRSDAGTSIVYRNAKDNVTFTGVSGEAWNAFQKGQPWRGCEAGKRNVNVPVVVRKLLARDGDGCFYCLAGMVAEDRSVEHLVSVTHGGPKHISNLVLAHRRCNAKAGHLSVMEKIRIREKARGDL